MMRARVLLIIAGLAVALGLLEIGLRLWYPQSLYAVRYSYLGWSHVPGVQFTHAGETREFVTRVRYNAQGLRDYDYPVEKPAGVQRVLVFGDSYGEALEVELEQTHAKLLERMLNGPAQAGGRVEVINFGVSAYDTAQEWWYFRNEGVRYDPDVVVVIWTGEAGSPFVRWVDGELVFLEPRFRRRDLAARAVKTWLKSRSHALCFLTDRLRLYRPVHQFLRELQVRPIEQGVEAAQAWAPAPQPATQWDARASDAVPPAWVSDPAAWELQLAIFGALARTAEEHGATLVIAATETEFAEGLKPFLKGALAHVRLVDLQVVSKEEERRYHYARDGHYNVHGHRKAAALLYEALVGERLVVTRGRAMAGDLAKRRR